RKADQDLAGMDHTDRGNCGGVVGCGNQDPERGSEDHNCFRVGGGSGSGKDQNQLSWRGCRHHHGDPTIAESSASNSHGPNGAGYRKIPGSGYAIMGGAAADFGRQRAGLGTLISGAYIGMQIGSSKESKRDFVALETPPVVTGEAGRFF